MRVCVRVCVCVCVCVRVRACACECVYACAASAPYYHLWLCYGGLVITRVQKLQYMFNVTLYMISFILTVSIS